MISINLSAYFLEYTTEYVYTNNTKKVGTGQNCTMGQN